MIDGGVKRGDSRADIRLTMPQLNVVVCCLIGMISHVEGLGCGGATSGRLVLAECSQTVSLEKKKNKNRHKQKSKESFAFLN